MKNYGARKLRCYRSQPEVIYDQYYDFSTERVVKNYEVPPLGRAVRVTDLQGEPIVLSRRKVRNGDYR